MTAHLSGSLSFVHPGTWSPRAFDILVGPTGGTFGADKPAGLPATAIHDAVATQLARLLERPGTETATGDAARHLSSFMQRVVVDGAPPPVVSCGHGGQLTLAFESVGGTVEATFLADGYCWVVLVSPVGAVRPLYDGNADVGLSRGVAHALGRFLRHLSRLSTVMKISVSDDEPRADLVSADPMDYDAARELATEIGGHYVARQRGAADEAERLRWFTAARALDDEVRAVDPFDDVQVGVLRAGLADRLRTLRS